MAAITVRAKAHTAAPIWATSYLTVEACSVINLVDSFLADSSPTEFLHSPLIMFDALVFDLFASLLSGASTLLAYFDATSRFLERLYTLLCVGWLVVCLSVH